MGTQGSPRSPNVDVSIPLTDTICMDVTVAEAAGELGVDERTVRAHVLSGRLQVTRVVGRTQLLEHAGVKALKRGSGRGRHWSARTAWASLELLDTDATSRLAGSERTRLRARLRDVDVNQLAHSTSARGRLRRFAHIRGEAGQLRERLHLSGMTALEDDDTAAVFNLVASPSRVTVGYVVDMDRFAVCNGLVESAEGDVFLRGMGTDDDLYLGMATYALDLFELGDTRESTAGARYLEARVRAQSPLDPRGDR